MSNASDESALGNPIYGESRAKKATTSNNVHPLHGNDERINNGSYSSCGPEYEPVHMANQEGKHGPTHDHREAQANTAQPTPYEIPVTGTLHIR